MGNVPPIEILQRFGLAVYLSLFFSFGIFAFTFWLMKHLLAQWEAERTEHQKFMSDSVRANTSALVAATDRLSDLGAMIRGVSEQLVRLETANRYQRDEHQSQFAILTELQKDVAVIGEKVK